ncbi:MAG TPA: hypothetical protein ENI90_08715 [Methylothermaceae bacterium]|nr:hypothetical protein [Methylothermaceae bacterium]
MPYFLRRSLLGILLLSLTLIQAQAGGRYQDAPANLNEILTASKQALTAIQSDNMEEALAAVTQARNLAKTSNKEKTTAPMQRASGQLRMARSALRRGDAVKAGEILEKLIPYLEQVKRSYE